MEDPSWFSSRLLGEATLIAIGAVVLGYLVSKTWPKAHNPQVFGTLAAVALLAGLAYSGSTAAGVALGVLLVIAVGLGVAGVLF